MTGDPKINGDRHQMAGEDVEYSASNSGEEFEKCLNLLLGVNEQGTKLRKDLKDDLSNSINKLREIYNYLVKKITGQEKLIKEFERRTETSKPTSRQETSGRKTYAEVVCPEQKRGKDSKQFNITIKVKDKLQSILKK